MQILQTNVLFWELKMSNDNRKPARRNLPHKTLSYH